MNTIKRQLKYTSALRMQGCFTTCLAQTTTGSWLLFALTKHLETRMEKNLKFSIF